MSYKKQSFSPKLIFGGIVSKASVIHGPSMDHPWVILEPTFALLTAIGSYERVQPRLVKGSNHSLTDCNDGSYRSQSVLNESSDDNDTDDKGID